MSMRFIAAMAASSCLASCAAIPPSDLAGARLAFNPFDTPEDRPKVLNTASVTGRLWVRDACVVIETASGPMTPLWPVGATLGRDGVIELPEGRGNARLGAKVRLTGSAFAQGQEPRSVELIPALCPLPYFATSNIGV